MGFPKSEPVTFNARFFSERTPTIMDGLVIRYKELPDDGGNHLEVSASRNGVMFSGYSHLITTEQQLEMYLDTIKQAWRDHVSIAGGRTDEIG